MKKYICYFQSIMTIGILTEARDQESAITQAADKLKDKNNVNHCYFNQTDFQAADVEEWNPEFEPHFDNDKSGLKFVFDPGPDVKNVIAARLHKSVNDLTQEDIADFVKESVESSLEG